MFRFFSNYEPIGYDRGDSMIFKNIEKVVGLRQPAGRDYGGYPIIKQKLSERDLSRDSIWMQTQL